jgi:hypothetical protein
MFPRTFYSYSKDFHEAFLSLGYNVTICNDEYPDSVFGKIMGKLQFPLLLSITNKVISQRFLRDETFDLVLIIKGRGMSVSLLEKLNQISPKIIGYNFDSFKFHKAPLKWLKNVSKYCTFDYRDAEVHKLSVVELFSSMPERLKPKNCKYEISAILKNHSKRLQFIDKVLLNISSEKQFIYIFERNILTFFKNFIKNPFLYLKYKKYISFKSLPYNDYAEVLLNSNFTIDFAHPSQTGITIRCFEALSSQTKIITNNPFILRNIHFNETNTIVFDKLSDPRLLKEHYNNIYNQKPVQYKRTIYDFINELIS